MLALTLVTCDDSVQKNFLSRFAIKTLAKHHAISHVMIQESGGPAKFFQRFPDLDLDTFGMQFVRDMMEQTFHNAINSNVKILEVCV